MRREVGVIGVGLLACVGAMGCGEDMVGVGSGTPRQFSGALTTEDAFLAIVGNDTRVNAYLCDGAAPDVTVAEWMSGDVIDGTFVLTSAGGARVEGAYAGDRAMGMVTFPGGATEAFTVFGSPGNAGLYRGQVEVDGITYEAGAIVVETGEQRGAVTARPPGMPLATPMTVIATPASPITDGIMVIAVSHEARSVTIEANEALNAYARR